MAGCVMIAPPNHGSAVARRFNKVRALRCAVCLSVALCCQLCRACRALRCAVNFVVLVKRCAAPFCAALFCAAPHCAVLRRTKLCCVAVQCLLLWVWAGARA